MTVGAFFLEPLGLLALLAVPAVVALHLFRRRFRPRVVSAVFLWKDPELAPSPGRKIERLRSSASLLLEVAAAALLALAFAGPKLPGAGEATHFVAVLDESASMSARRAPGAPSAADRARDLVRERVAALPRGSRVTLVASGRRPRCLAGPAAFAAEALERLDASPPPSAASHDLAPAVALALEVAEGKAVLLVTDRFEPEAFPPEVEVVSLGEPLPNVAIARAVRARERDRLTGEGKYRERLRLSISNAGRDRATRRVLLREADSAAVLLERDVEIPPGGAAALTVDLPEGTPALEVALQPEDALAIDDRAFLVPEPARPLAVASSLGEETERLLGLTSKQRLDRLSALVPDASATGDTAAADLVLAPAPVEAPRRAWVLAIGPRSSDAERVEWTPPFLAEKRHPLLDGVTLDGVAWTASAGGPPLDGIPLLSAGNVPLLIESPPGERRAYRMDIDPARSTIARSPDWPILLANLLEMRRRALPGPERANLVSGEPLAWRADEGDEAEAAFTLAREDGAATTIALRARGSLVVDDPGAPGFFRLRREDGGEWAFAIRFADPAESALGERLPGRREARAAGEATVASGHGGLESALLLAALAAILGDWWALSRGRRSSR